ncbi:MAG: peptide-binding protein [Fusobacterium sp.]|nr:peptide-binding protein [Fusobacterium sp.]
MKKKFILYFISIFTLILFIGCGKKEDKKIVKQEFFTVMPKEKYTLNPHIYKDDYSRAIIIQLWEGITELKPEGARLVSADTIEHSEDFKTWTIKLRKDLKWSDGKKIDADTYLKSWLSALQNKDVSEEVYRLFVIENAKNIFDKKNNIEKFGVETKDNILTIHLNTPIENFDEWLANPIFYPIREENKNIKLEESQNLIVNGAFKVKNISEEEINLEKNKTYWDNINTKLTNVNIVFVKDKIMAYEMFPRLEIDFFGAPFYRIPYERRKQFRTLPEAVIFPVNRYSFISFPSNNKFINSREVKQTMYAVSDPNFMGEVIMQNNSPSIFKHPQPDSAVREKAKEEFLALKDKDKISFEDKVFTAYRVGGRLFETRYILSVLKEWISLFKMPIRVTSSKENTPDFALNKYLIGSNNIKDFYYYINYKYQNLDEKLLIKSEKEFLEKLPVLPLNKIYDSVLVQSQVDGLYLEPNGDLHLKYINILNLD